jgi:hypothetical protein
MWKLIRKWWFLQRLEDQILLYTGKENSETIFARRGGPTLSSDDFFIKGTQEWPGIASRPLGKYLSWLLFWRWCENRERYNRRIYEYMDFLKYWKEKSYIDYAKIIQSNGNMIQTNMPHLTSKADDIHGLVGLLELIQQTYPLTWGAMLKLCAFVITTLMTSVVGAYFLIKLGNYIIHHYILHSI